MSSIGRLLVTHRSKLARITALAGVLTLCLVIMPAVPRPLDVEVDLGQAHQQIVEVRVSYLQSGEELQHVAFAFPQGAPLRVHHSLKVPVGDVEVYAEALRADGNIASEVARVHAPADGTVRIHVPVAAH